MLLRQTQLLALFTTTFLLVLSASSTFAQSQTQSQSSGFYYETTYITEDKNGNEVMVIEQEWPEEADLQEKPTYSTFRFSISETNDAAVMGLQESLTPEEYRPNDVGYTHGMSIEIENNDGHLFGMSGSYTFSYVSDLVTEFTQRGGNNIQNINFDDLRVLAIDIYRIQAAFEQHAKASGFKSFYGVEFEYLTDSSPTVSFLSARERQEAWHTYYNSDVYNYHEDGISRYSLNALAGIGFENSILNFAKVDLKAGVLAKASPSSQARNESKLFSDLRFSINDTVKGSRYYLEKQDRFILSLGAKGEFGVGKKLEAYAGIDKNFSFDSFGDFELAFFAHIPIIQNFFEFSDFTAPREFNEARSWEGGIIDYEPVYTLKISYLW